MKKIFLLALVCLMTMPVWAGNEPTFDGTKPSALSLQGLQPKQQPSLLIPASAWSNQKSNDFIIDEGFSYSYIFSPRFQLGFQSLFWMDNFYFGSQGGWNFGKDYYASERPTQPLFNPFAYSSWKLGVKLGPVMLGCSAGYSFDAPKAHWLYMFGFLPGVCASAINKWFNDSPTFFDGVYFMWGPEAHLQLGKLMLTGGYRMAPKLDMDHLYFGIGYVFDDIPD